MINYISLNSLTSSIITEMVRRYRRRRTRRPRRIRRRRTFRRRRAGANYDGAIALKIHGIHSMVYSNITGHADFTVMWGTNATTGTNNYLRLMDANEWITFANLY